MVRTTPPKEGKVGTSSTQPPMAQALVARLGCKASDDTLADDDIDFLNFGTLESKIVCHMSSLLQSCWPNSGKLDYLVWDSGWSSFCAPNAGPAFLVLGHEDVEGGLWAALLIAPLILLPMAILPNFWLNDPRWPILPYDGLLPFGRLSQRWPN
jgi:hypothetical protein